MTGSISSIGIGSGLQLQDILDQLRGLDEKVINSKEDKVSELESQFNEFNVVKNKLLAMKSYALDLSLSSTFLGRDVSSSDDTVLDAVVSDGATVQTTTVNVTRLATRSSWMSASGMSSTDAVVYVPTSQESTTGAASASAAGYITSNDTLTLTYGSGTSQQTIAVNLTAGMSLNDVVQAVNTDDNNGGSGSPSLYVTAETFESNGAYYLRIKSSAGGTGETNRVMVTGQASDITLQAPSKTLMYGLGDDTTLSMSVAADTTVSQLAAQINNDANNPGVTASVIDNGDTSAPYRLILEADTSGEDNRITILTPLPDINLTEQQGAESASLNAAFAINGISYQRQTNTVTDVLSGVTMTLKDAGTASISVVSNDTALGDLITNLVTSYNDAVEEINNNANYDENEQEYGILADTTLRSLPFALENLMTSTNNADADGNITSLFDLGLTFNRGGTTIDASGTLTELPTISIDSDTLAAAISDHPDGVKDFFLGDEDRDITGFADLVNERLRTLTIASGQIEAEKDIAQNKIDDMEEQISLERERLDKKYDIMTKQFIELDRYMNQMTSISNYLTSQFTSLINSSNNNGTSN